MRVALICSVVSMMAHADELVGHLEKGAVGVFYVLPGTDAGLERIEVVFPIGQVTHERPLPDDPADIGLSWPVKAAAPIALYDAQGFITEVTPRFRARSWCHNDGGLQFRPNGIVTLPVDPNRRAFTPDKALQGWAGIAVVGKSSKPPMLSSERSGTARHALKVNQRWVLITAAPDPAHNCSGTPNNNLEYSLELGAEVFSLRCCGP